MKQYRKNYKDLTIQIIGKRGGVVDLTLEEFPDDEELRVRMLDDTYQAEWKDVYIEMAYEEALSNRRETRRHMSYNDIDSDECVNKKLKKYLSDGRNDFTEEFIADEVYELLTKDLTPTQKKRLDQHILRCDSYVQIARDEGVDESAVRRSINEAKKKIKKLLKERPI